LLFTSLHLAHTHFNQITRIYIPTIIHSFGLAYE